MDEIRAAGGWCAPSEEVRVPWGGIKFSKYGEREKMHGKYSVDVTIAGPDGEAVNINGSGLQWHSVVEVIGVAGSLSEILQEAQEDAGPEEPEEKKKYDITIDPSSLPASGDFRSPHLPASGGPYHPLLRQAWWDQSQRNR